LEHILLYLTHFPSKDFLSGTGFSKTDSSPCLKGAAETDCFPPHLISGKTSEAVNAAMAALREEYGERFSQVFKTITVDNGSEFAEFSMIEQWGTKIYFAHPEELFEAFLDSVYAA